MRLSDRVVIVTGAGRGIGRAYALGLAAEGARVVAADVLDCRPVGTEIETRGGQALAVACDVSREADTQRLATETLARFGRIDALVNNAALYGNLERRPFMEIPVEEWDQVMAVNLRGLFLCSRAVFPAMKAQGKGVIVNISSSTFFKGVPDYIHYTTSKGGVVGFTRSLARELGPHGIRVNAQAVDVRDEDSVASFVAAAEKQLGAVRLLVATAGIYPNSHVVDMDVEEWDRVMETNVRGVFLTCRAAARSMVAHGTPGKI